MYHWTGMHYIDFYDWISEYAKLFVEKDVIQFSYVILALVCITGTAYFFGHVPEIL